MMGMFKQLTEALGFSIVFIVIKLIIMLCLIDVVAARL